MTRSVALVAELVDALASGASDRKVVKVRVLSWAPVSKERGRVYWGRSRALFALRRGKDGHDHPIA
jgi:hypothetical protein